MSTSAATLPLSMTSSGGIHDTTAHRTVTSCYDTTTSYEQSRRQVSSVVVSEQVIGELPESGGIKYVEVPVIEEVIKRVPKKEIIEVEKVVPKYEVEYVERVVEVPQIHYIDKQVERPTVQEILIHKPVKQIQEIPREVIKTVPKIETVVVEKIVNVPGQVVEVPKPYVVENKVPVKRFQDKNMPVVVAQTIRPVITESNEVIDVDVYHYEPQIIPVDIHVAKPVPSHLVAVGAVEEYHQVVSVPAAQYNSILRSVNAHLGGDLDALPYIKEGNQIPFLAGHEIPGTLAPMTGVAIETTVGTRSHGAQVSQQDVGAMTTTTSSLYQPIGSVNQMENKQMETVSTQMTVPPVYPNITTGEAAESFVPSVVRTQSHYNKSQKSGLSFAVSQPVRHKRQGCRC